MDKNVLEREVSSFSYAFEGLVYALRTQSNFRFQIGIAVLVIAAAIFLGFTRGEFIVLFIVIGLVLSSELLNTVVEVVVDLVIETTHAKAKIAKDVSAAVVLVNAVFSVIVGILLFWPHLLLLFGSKF